MNLSRCYAQCRHWAEKVWYKDPFLGLLLMPLGFVFSDAVRFRKFLYRIGVLKTERLPVPVIVVGNITVGGTGKTPLLIRLVEVLKDAGYRPGIISRGYRGHAASWPQSVRVDSSAEIVGDEALLLACRTASPVVVGSSRVAAAKQLLAENDCTVILSDDGMQHYALHRDIEIAVVDGERRYGNGYCLPAGPLREPIGRLQSVDWVVVNGEKYEDYEYEMRLYGDSAVNLSSGERKSLTAFIGVDCHALAGIGNPERFFRMLAAAGVSCRQRYAFPDHYHFQADDITFADNVPVLMTEKDAVKCRAFAGPYHWYVPVTAQLDAAFTEQFLAHLQQLAAVGQ